MSELTHFNADGQVHMVDVGAKEVTERRAIAGGYISMETETLDLIAKGNHKKGDVLAVARLAGIMASKRTADLIPLCHPLSLSHVSLDLELQQQPPAVHCSGNGWANRGRNGSIDRRTNCPVDHLRYVQSGRPRNAH